MFVVRLAICWAVCAASQALCFEDVTPHGHLLSSLTYMLTSKFSLPDGRIWNTPFQGNLESEVFTLVVNGTGRSPVSVHWWLRLYRKCLYVCGSRGDPREELLNHLTPNPLSVSLFTSQ